MNGNMPLQLNARQHFLIFGGPYAKRPYDMIGVRMAKELHRLDAEIVIPTVDFQTPPKAEMDAGLDEAVTRILMGQPLYVGCMGGIGRTGLFLAVLAKAFGESDPVAFVRRHYIPHAVETVDQQRYVAQYEVPAWTLKKIKMARFFMRIFRKNLLTRVPNNVS